MGVMSAVRRAVQSSLDVLKQVGNKIPGSQMLNRVSFTVPSGIPIIGGFAVTGSFLAGLGVFGLVTGWVPFIPHYSQVM